MRYSDKLEFFENLEMEGNIVPAMESRPFLYKDLEPVFGIFWDLSGSRPVSFSGAVGSISFAEIEAYFRLYRIDMYDLTLKRIRLMDRIYRELVNAKVKRK